MATITVNGRAHEVTAAADTPLLWVLRDELGLTGTKYGCGEGRCGACTVHLGGRPVRACQTPLGQVRDRAVTTIEGLSADGTHPVQLAWLAEDVAQCGYCQPGVIMTTAALLSAGHRADAPAVTTALDGHICRCGSYVRMRRAVERVLGEAR